MAVQSKAPWDYGLDARFTDPASNERPVLIFLFLMIYMSYGAIGRDIFYNQFNAATTSDPIGYYLPWIRVGACSLAALIVIVAAGLTWSLSKIPLMFAPFCVMALVSASWSDDPKQAFRNALVLTFMWVALPMVIHRLGVAQAVRSSLHLIAGVVIASAFFAIAVPSIGTHTGAELAQNVHAGRWRGIFVHKNALGPWAAYGSVFLLTHSHLCSGPRLYWLFAWLCGIACLVMAGSATSVGIAVAAALTVLAIRLSRTYHIAVILAVYALGACMAGILLGLTDGSVLGLLGRDSSLTGRTEIWAYATDAIMEAPWLGHGYSGLGGVEFLDRLEAAMGQAVPGPESGYLTLALEMGAVGLVLFFVPFLVSIKNAFEWIKHVQSADRDSISFLIAIMMCTFVSAVTESNSLMSTGFDGVIAFTAFFAMLTTPKSPEAIRKATFRHASNVFPVRRVPADAGLMDRT